MLARGRDASGPSAPSECLWNGRMARAVGWSYLRTMNRSRASTTTLGMVCTMIPIKALR
jgi:hypothetical protein